MRSDWTKVNMTRIEFSAADPAACISRISKLGVALYRVRYVDDLSVQAYVKQDFLDLCRQEIAHQGGTCRIVQPSNVFRLLHRIPRRIVFILSIATVLFLTVFIPSRVLFIKVSGNSAVPTNLILEKAESCGIYFGTLRSAIRSEEIKNSLIAQIPSLQWVGINTNGCVAEISVREKGKVDIGDVPANTVSNIVAARDGIIISKTILQGTATCKVGQAVVAGQVLVSGYTDCGMVIQATRADGEVLARTKRETYVTAPIHYKQRCEVMEHTTRYSLLFGKKLINLYKDSGISGGSCVKICERDDLSLPGGYFLPIGLITEHIYSYDIQDAQCYDFGWLESFSDSYLETQMIAGQIIDSSTSISFDTERVCLVGQYDCIEMIGQRKLEENMDAYGVCN